MDIFLQVLKIIGFVLAGIAALVLLILLLVLFVPIRYDIKASYGPDEKVLKVSGKVSYLLHLIRASVSLVGTQLDYSVMIAWIKLFSKGKADRTDLDDLPDAPEPDSAAAKPKDEISDEPDGPEISDEPDGPEISDESDGPEISGETDGFKRKRKRDRDRDRDRNRARKPKKNGFAQFKKKVVGLKHKLIELNSKRENIVNEINDYRNRQAFSHIIKALKKIFKHMSPRKQYVNIMFGTGDPADTGQILGYMYVVGTLLRLNLTVVPDFYNKVFVLDARLKGHVTIFVIAFQTLRLYMDKNIKRLYRRISKYGR